MKETIRQESRVNRTIEEVLAEMMDIPDDSARELLDGTVAITRSELLKLAKRMHMSVEDMGGSYQIRLTLRADELVMLAEYNGITVEELLRRKRR